MNPNRRTFIGAAATWIVAAPLATRSALVYAQGGDVAWVDDAVPAGAILGSDGDAWNWISANPTPYSGTLAHRSVLAGGEHQHYFYNATATLSAAVGDTLFAYVYLDPANPPSEVMLQWYDGSWEHRAYWGANLIVWGSGSNTKTYMGPLPLTGQWVRLEVPAGQVGLEGHTLNGMAFTLYDGRATWDYAGKNTSTDPPPPPPNGTFVTNPNGTGNVAQGDSSAAGGVNSVTGPDGHGALAFGLSATANAPGAIAISRDCQANGEDSFVAGARCVTFGDNGRAAGYSSVSSGDAAFAHGLQANDRDVFGAEAYASGGFSSQNNDDVALGVADAQTVRLTLRAKTNSATPAPLTTDGNGPQYNNQALLPDKASYVMKWLVVARDVSNGDSRSWEILAMATRGIGVASTVLIGWTINDIAHSSGAAGWNVSLVADPSLGTIQLSGIGEAGKSIQWVAVMIDAENVG